MTRKVGAKRRFLIVRHRSYRRFFFDILCRWVKINLPSLDPWFEVRDLPVRVKDWSRYALHTAWLQDPVQRWSMDTYVQSLALAEECERHRVPVVNRVDRLLNATKFRGSQLMSAAGVRVPRMALVEDPNVFERDLCGLSLPLFIREDWGHDHKCFRIDAPSDLPLVPWQSFKRPLAVELTDVRSPHDGLFRKYRFVAAGDVGVSHHLHVSQEWITRGENRVINPLTRAEELAYITQPDSNQEVLQRARLALGLDLVAFDYGYTPDGRLIVWEANPFPHFVFAQTIALQEPGYAPHDAGNRAALLCGGQSSDSCRGGGWTSAGFRRCRAAIQNRSQDKLARSIESVPARVSQMACLRHCRSESAHGTRLLGNHRLLQPNGLA